MQRVDKERVAGNRWMMRTGRGPTVAGTTTQYQPPFHRITQRRAIRLPRPAARTSAAFVRARLSSPLLFSLSSCRYTAFSRRRALTSVFSPPRAVVGRVVIVPEASPSRLSLSELLPLSSISCAKFGNVSRATSLNVSESFARARTTGERLSKRRLDRIITYL